ncbi:MAG: hypothetical protein AAGI17_00255 [Planctomycetota bacterium]
MFKRVAGKTIVASLACLSLFIAALWTSSRFSKYALARYEYCITSTTHEVKSSQLVLLRDGIVLEVHHTLRGNEDVLKALQLDEDALGTSRAIISRLMQPDRYDRSRGHPPADFPGFGMNTIAPTSRPLPGWDHETLNYFILRLDWWLLTALPATPWLISTALLTRRQLRRRHRRKHGLCLNCGYELSKATPCPECGAGAS